MTGVFSQWKGNFYTNPLHTVHTMITWLMIWLVALEWWWVQTGSGAAECTCVSHEGTPYDGKSLLAVEDVCIDGYRAATNNLDNNNTKERKFSILWYGDPWSSLPCRLAYYQCHHQQAAQKARTSSWGQAEKLAHSGMGKQPLHKSFPLIYTEWL